MNNQPFHACFEQGVPWHSGNYRVWIHSETRRWHDRNRVIGNHVKFIDTTKYYKQSLSSLASNADKTEKLNVRSSCEKFIRKHSLFSKTFDFLSDEEKGWVLNNFSSSKGVIPYKMIRSYENLDATPPEKFFTKTEFYS